MEQPPEPGERPPLRYDEGWEELLTAPDAYDYQVWLSDLVEQAYLHPDLRIQPLESVRYAWQMAIEAIADKAISEQDKFRFTEAEIIETALHTLHANVEAAGWLEEGVAFMVPDLRNDAVAEIDIRTFIL